MAIRLLGKLLAYYVVVALFVALLLWIFPTLDHYLPIGRVEGLIKDGAAASAGGNPFTKSEVAASIAHHVDSLGSSLVWLTAAIIGALLTSLPVSWTYMEVRDREQYDQSLVGAILLLPMVITSIVVIVKDSLALSFSLAGIVGAVRFRNTLKSTGDLLFIMVSIAIGLSAGIGAMELAAVTSIAFNLCFVLLWATEYGERSNMKRFLGDYDPDDEESRTTTTVEVSTVSVSATTVETGPAVGEVKKV